MTWKTAGELVREMVARLERKGLGTVAESAPSQWRVTGGTDASQTVDGGPRVQGNLGRAILCFIGHDENGTGTNLTHRGSISIFHRISARNGVGDRQPVVLVIIHDLGPHLIAAACDLHDGQRSGE